MHSSQLNLNSTHSLGSTRVSSCEMVDREMVASAGKDSNACAGFVSAAAAGCKQHICMFSYVGDYMYVYVLGKHCVRSVSVYVTKLGYVG